MGARTRPGKESLGRRVREARRGAGMSQAALAAQIDLERSAVSKIESGRRGVGSLELARIGRALDRPVAWFLGEGSGPSDPIGELRRKRRAILRVLGRHGGRSVRVFGSVARGDAGSGSDLDLLVELEPGRSLFDQAALSEELRELLGGAVDVVTPEGLRPGIRDRVLREAFPL